MIQINDKKDCCGCGACMLSCPSECISLKEDKEGFLYPNITADLCIDCGACERSCPVLNCELSEGVLPDAYVAYADDDVLRENSSSGGMFSLFAENILNSGGVVFGAAFDSDFTVHHIVVESVDELSKLRGSKYLQSRTENAFKEAEDYLKSGRKVLYTGTACQIAGLKRYLKRDYTNLYTVDVLCHGVPSPKVWKKYLEEQEKTHGAAVRRTFFRNKKYGWKTYAVSLDFSNETVYERIFKEDSFMKLFLGNICLRPSCHDCKFKGLSRPSDITIGDCWGIEKIMPDMDDDKGASVVLLHSEKGKELFRSLSNKMCVRRGEVDDLLNPHADSRKSVAMHRNRRKFFKEFEKGRSTIDEMTKLLEPPFCEKVKNKIIVTLVEIKHKLTR